MTTEYADDLDTAVAWNAEAETCIRTQAQWAVCEYGHVLRGAWPKGVGTSVWLHRNGSCPTGRVIYWRFA